MPSARAGARGGTRPGIPTPAVAPPAIRARSVSTPAASITEAEGGQGRAQSDQEHRSEAAGGARQGRIEAATSVLHQTDRPTGVFRPRRIVVTSLQSVVRTGQGRGRALNSSPKRPMGTRA